VSAGPLLQFSTLSNNFQKYAILVLPMQVKNAKYP